MKKIFDFFNIHKKEVCVPLDQQRKMWGREFSKAFLVVFIAYAIMYVIRASLKGLAPVLKSDYGFSESDYGDLIFWSGLIYGIGKFVVGYAVDGRNTKRIISFLLTMSAAMVLIFGLVLWFSGKQLSILILLWCLNCFFQAAGGPASYSTISRWTPNSTRGKYLGWWNMSHNIGGLIAAPFAFWCATTFFGGNISGAFVIPALLALVIGIVSMFIGKDEPEELGWNSSNEIFNEIEKTENVESEKMSKFDIFKQFILKNPWIWILCFANIFTYVVRLGVFNWSALYVTQHLGLSKEEGIHTVVIFEFGAIFGSFLWGYISDLLKGRRALLAAICLGLTTFAVIGYMHATNITTISISLFILGFLIFGPQLLIGISLAGFSTKQSIAVANGLSGTFAYIFAESIVGKCFGQIVDPKKSGLHLFGNTFHGWDNVFQFTYISIAIGVVLLLAVAYKEEKRIRSAKKLKDE